VNVAESSVSGRTVLVMVSSTVRELAPAGAPRLGEAVAKYLGAGGLSAGTVEKYRGTLRALVREFGAELPVGWLGTGDAPDRLVAWFGDRFGELAAATRARHLSTLRAAVAWWAVQGWLAADPTIRLRHPRVPVDRTRALTRAQVEALWELPGVALRERTLWRLLYESAARSAEVLGLDVEELDLPNKRAAVTRKGNRRDVIHWQTGTARLLPRLIAGRRRGPLFLTERRACRPVAALDLDPASGRARLSYRRAAALFDLHTRPLAHPGATAEELAELDGWDLHQLRHAALTHDAESGTSAPLLMARSGHSSVRSLARYAVPSVEAVGRHVAEQDPAARRRRD
jgi:integrase/recombinase XerD